MIENKIQSMILAKFRHKYPQGSLVSKLIEIDRGTYIVKASVRVDNVILATGLAGAATVEAAEDAARERAIAALSLEASANTTPVNSVRVEQIAAPATASASPQVSVQENVNFSKPPQPESQLQPQPVSQEQPLTPVTVPLKPVVETIEPNPEPETTPIVSPEPAPTNSLFGDTFTAQTPIEPVIDARRDSSATELDSTSQEQAMDFNEIKQKTDIEIKRLSWTKDQGKEFLMSRYGKRSRLHLTDEQLLEFLRYLETLPNPVK